MPNVLQVRAVSNSSQSNKLTTTVVMIFVATVCIVSAADAGTIYTWRDSNGVAQFSDTCPADVDCRLTHIGSAGDPLAAAPKAAAVNSLAADQGVPMLHNVGVVNTGGSAEVQRRERKAAEFKDTSSGTRGSAGTATFILSWSALEDERVRGYRVFYAVKGTPSGQLGSGIDVGNQTSYTVSGLQGGVEYYFLVSAFGTSGELLASSSPAYVAVP
jgi:hypothetical protein